MKDNDRKGIDEELDKLEKCEMENGPQRDYSHLIFASCFGEIVLYLIGSFIIGFKLEESVDDSNTKLNIMKLFIFSVLSGTIGRIMMRAASSLFTVLLGITILLLLLPLDLSLQYISILQICYICSALLSVWVGS